MEKEVSEKVTVHIYLRREVRDMFSRLYPNCLSRFVENALILASSDKNVFDRIFFKDILNV